MSDQFLAEIRVFGFNFAPQGWATCSGQTLSISQNTALFSLLGTTYGGNGTSTFQLPNLQENVVVGAGQSPGLQLWTLGETQGTDNVTLLISQMPGHTHQAYAGDGVAFASQTAAPTSSSYLGREKAGSYAATANTTLAANAVGTGGGNQSHNNQMPTLSMTFCIALVGIYPTRN